MKELRPFSPTALNLGLQAEVRRDGKLLRFTFILSGDVERLIIPVFSRPLRRQDELWKTTCLEAFISTPGTQRYWELNFSPSGAWNCYRFDDYRQGMRAEEGAHGVEIQPRQGIKGYQLHATVDLSSVISPEEPLEASLTAVIARLGVDEPSYWAFKHVGKVPDFHLREGFELQPSA